MKHIYILILLCLPLKAQAQMEGEDVRILLAGVPPEGMALSFDQGYWHTPPADAVFLHRKLGGLYLLAARLRAKVDVHIILERYLHHA